MQRDDCPSDEILIAFHLGELPEDILDSVREHQESCPSCESKARRLDGEVDQVLEDLRTVVARVGLEAAPNGAVHDRRQGIEPTDEPQALATDHPFEAHDLVLRDYEVDESPLGQGSMGIVYKARHRKLDRTVALKMIASPSREISALFQIEAKAVAQLQHPNIVQIFEIGEHEGRPFLSFEFVEGGSLERKIREEPQSPRQAAEMVRTLALAVDYAHRQGIAHCDLKPSNILMTPEGVPKIVDFGIAKWLRSKDQWTQDGDIVGTPRYMAPEQATGSVDRVGPATDVYSLGVILYEMLVGRAPHPAAKSLETLALVREQEPEPPRRLQPKIARDLETIVLKCLRKDPSKRYGDAKALAEDLQRYLSGLPILARPVGTLETTYLWAKRHRTIAGVVTITTLWLVVFGLFYRHYHATLQRHNAAWSDASKTVSKVPQKNRPETIIQADGALRLGAASATVYGNTLEFEAPYGNLGFWHSSNDRAVWTFRVDEPGSFAISLDYACIDRGAGNAYEIRVGDTIIQGKVAGTGAWSDYRSMVVGNVTLAAGIHQLEVRSRGTLHGALFDLRAVSLTPR